jgi:hypothetical protein
MLRHSAAQEGARVQATTTTVCLVPGCTFNGAISNSKVLLFHPEYLKNCYFYYIRI